LYVAPSLLCAKVRVPELFIWHQQDFITTLNPVTMATTDTKEPAPPTSSTQTDALLAFIATQLEGEKEAELHDLITMEGKVKKNG